MWAWRWVHFTRSAVLALILTGVLFTFDLMRVSDQRKQEALNRARYSSDLLMSLVPIARELSEPDPIRWAAEQASLGLPSNASFRFYSAKLRLDAGKTESWQWDSRAGELDFVVVVDKVTNDGFRIVVSVPELYFLGVKKPGIALVYLAFSFLIFFWAVYIILTRTKLNPQEREVRRKLLAWSKTTLPAMRRTREELSALEAEENRKQHSYQETRDLMGAIQRELFETLGILRKSSEALKLVGGAAEKMETALLTQVLELGRNPELTKNVEALAEIHKGGTKIRQLSEGATTALLQSESKVRPFVERMSQDIQSIDLNAQKLDLEKGPLTQARQVLSEQIEEVEKLSESAASFRKSSGTRP